MHTILWICLFATVIITGAFEHKKYPSRDDFYADIMQIAMEPRVITDNRGIILYAAPSAAELMGYEQQEITGKNVEIVIPERYLLQHSGKIARAIASNDGTIVATKCYLKKKDNSEELIEIRTKVVDTESGKIIVATLIPVDKIEEVPGFR